MSFCLSINRKKYTPGYTLVQLLLFSLHTSLVQRGSSPAHDVDRDNELIPLNALLASATNLRRLKLLVEFMCHLDHVQTAGVTPGSVVTSDGPLPEPQLAGVLSQM